MPRASRKRTAPAAPVAADPVDFDALLHSLLRSAASPAVKRWAPVLQLLDEQRRERAGVLANPLLIPLA